jgi:succinoglycan biosynthesis protein ExoM
LSTDTNLRFLIASKMRHMIARHVDVCICTYKRPLLLKRLLEALERQQSGRAFTFSIVVADNDAGRSAQEVVTLFSARSSINTVYCCESRQNIALARNKAIEYAQGEFIAFIDDDEFPADNWLALLLKACDDFQSAGVLGPVRPHFEQPPPPWIVKGGFCERPEYPTGTVMNWGECRTGNTLFRRAILEGVGEPFNQDFGTGGEDKDFFLRMSQRGFVFVWCNEAAAYETVPPSRWTRSYMIRRALLRGRNVLKHPTGRLEIVAKSVVAVPAYSLLLPFALMLGQQSFMKYCIKFCDHLGRLLALVGLNRINERQM